MTISFCQCNEEYSQREWVWSGFGLIMKKSAIGFKHFGLEIGHIFHVHSSLVLVVLCLQGTNFISLNIGKFIALLKCYK